VGGGGGGYGDLGIILHYDGTSWSSMSLPSDHYYHLWGVWGSSGTDVFAVGEEWEFSSDAGILHYDGTSWSPMPCSAEVRLLGAWGASGTDVFAVGNGRGNSQAGAILHYDGVSWTGMDSGVIDSGLSAVWGTAGSDVFVVGADFTNPGIILHYDGWFWSRMPHCTDNCLGAVWGSSGSDVFAAGEGGTILRYAASTGVRLELNYTFFEPGETFLLAAVASNASAEPLAAQLYVLLDLQIGEYWFWPSWKHWPPDVDSQAVYLDPQSATPYWVLNFTWPNTGDLTMDGIRVWGALVDSSMSVVGEIGHVEFGFWSP
jgi:hypothetical protein